jgi:hypothetical protein
MHQVDTPQRSVKSAHERQTEGDTEVRDYDSAQLISSLSIVVIWAAPHLSLLQNVNQAAEKIARLHLWGDDWERQWMRQGLAQ